MDFHIYAYDAKDPEAKSRRMAVRQAHLDGIQELIKTGNFMSGGAILNDKGDMIGSTVHLTFASRQELDEWLKTEPYVTGKVWADIQIQNIKLTRR